MFRPEAIERQRGRLSGNVHLFVPISWHLIGYGLLAIVTASLLFLFLGSYARVETVTGQIEPDLGSAAIMPTRAGIITSIPISEGTSVRAGAPVATIRAEEIDAGGGTGPEKVLAALKERDGRLAAQGQSILTGASATRARLLGQQQGLRAELAALDKQIDAQQHLIQTAQDDWVRVQAVAQRGFISKRELQAREDLLTSRQQQLAALVQTRADKAATLGGTDRAIEEAVSQAQATAAGIAGSRASVAQKEYDVAASRGYTLTAPVSGIVTALMARIGQSAQTSTSLMTIVPAGAHLQAWLYVPTQAAGFLTIGQDVRLQIDAFPFARFGTVPAKIVKISNAAINHPTSSGQAEPVYLVTASIADPGIHAFNHYQHLQPDMTLTARIITEKRSLAEWLFEPILAVRRR